LASALPTEASDRTATQAAANVNFIVGPPSSILEDQCPQVQRGSEANAASLAGIPISPALTKASAGRDFAAGDHGLDPGLGFSPLAASGLSLIANTAPVA
jgi:hypothetical protein